MQMKEILVYANWAVLPHIMLMGKLRTELIKGEEIFSFEYDTDWLDSGMAQHIDPDLKLYKGPQYLPDARPNFGLFLDSSPDRWGRMLMKRRESLRARNEGEKPRVLHESDFLLGVNDESRMGGIRFKLEESGVFLESSAEIKTPPITSIRELEQASLRIEDDDFFDDTNARKWLHMLLAPGSSLGGARPKASVLDSHGHLYIAKFPSKNDHNDAGIWECLVNQMAKKVAINVAESWAVKYSQKEHTYLTKRFDRTIDHKRVHFASAMTLLGYKDGHNHKDGGSYLEIVELIEQYGAEPEIDIRELWRRIVFSVAVSNTDDHLRNHGFLLTRNGWRLSPAYDINPNENGIGLSLNISENDNSLDFELCMEVADYFRWKTNEAKAYINKVKKEISKWPLEAKALNIPNNQIFMMENAFSK